MKMKLYVIHDGIHLQKGVECPKELEELFISKGFVEELEKPAKAEKKQDKKLEDKKE